MMVESDELTLNIDDSGDSKSKKKGGGALTKKKLLIALVLVAVVGAVAAGGWVFMTKKKASPPPETVQEPDNGTSSETVEVVHFKQLFELDRMEIPLGDMGGGRTIRVLIRLETEVPETLDDIRRNRSRIEEIITTILSSKTLDELLHADGKIVIRHEIVKRVNQILDSGRIRNVYFSEFLII